MILLLTLLVCLACIALMAVWPLFALGSAAMAVLLALQGFLYFRQSRIDALTGLLNIRKLKDRKRIYRSVPAVTVIYLDVNHLKQINDTQGHGAGDRLLKDVAHNLRMFRRDAHIFRLGGDEFLLIFQGPGSETFADRWSRSAIDAAYGSASGPGRDLDYLIQQAENAMYQQKKGNGK